MHCNYLSHSYIKLVVAENKSDESANSKLNFYLPSKNTANVGERTGVTCIQSCDCNFKTKLASSGYNSYYNSNFDQQS